MEFNKISLPHFGRSERIALSGLPRFMQAIVRTSPLGLAALAAPALADIPFTTDDPGTLAAGEYEILAYSDGTITSMDFPPLIPASRGSRSRSHSPTTTPRK